MRGGGGADGVNYREGEFPFGEVFGVAFVRGVGGGEQVEVVVADLEEEAEEGDEGGVVARVFTLRLHEFDGQAKQAAGFVADHFEVVVFGRAGERVAPEQVHALAAVQVAELVGVDFDGGGVVEFCELGEGGEVDVVCGVDRLGGAEDAVGDGDAAAEEGGVFDVVDAGGGVVLEGVCMGGWGWTYSREAVCSIPTTRVIISRLCSGTLSQALKAVMSCFLMSFPG